MNGWIDEHGRALLSVEIRTDSTLQAVAIDVWIDTGFTGELVLPHETIDSLALRHSGSVDAMLADGSQIELNTYTCFVNWFGEERRLEVVASDGDSPLLGVGLLLGLELRLNYHTRELALDVPYAFPSGWWPARSGEVYAMPRTVGWASLTSNQIKPENHTVVGLTTPNARPACKCSLR